MTVLIDHFVSILKIALSNFCWALWSLIVFDSVEEPTRPEIMLHSF